MLAFASGAIGIIIGIITLLAVGPFIVYKITKLIDFKTTTLKHCFQFWIIYIVTNYTLNFALKYIISGFFSNGATDPSTALILAGLLSSLSLIIDIVVLLSLTKYWFKENWGKTIGSAILFYIAQMIIIAISVFIPILIVGTINFGA